MGPKCMVVAEIAQAHDGSLGAAHAYIDAVAKSGADAIKFQTHIPEAESTPGEPWRIKFSYQDETRYDYWKRVSFTKEQWLGLANHAREKGLIFFSSPFSLEAVDLLEELQVPFYKLGAGELTNLPLIEKVAKTGKHVFISTGMGSWDEVDQAVEWLRSFGSEFTVFQCTSEYPCPPEHVGINVLQEISDRYGCEVGFSDHSGVLFPGLAAATLGASVIEVHVCFSKETFGPDVSSSLTLDELKTLCEGVRYINVMNANPVSKDMVSEELSDMKKLFYKSLVANQDIEVGTILTEDLIAIKKPGTGIPAYKINEFIGKKMLTNISKDQMLRYEDIERSE